MADNKRLIITGVSGLLGNNLAYHLKDQYDILGLFYTHPFELNGILTETCDLSHPKRFARVFDEFNPDIINLQSGDS